MELWRMGEWENWSAGVVELWRRGELEWWSCGEGGHGVKEAGWLEKTGGA